MSAVIAWADVLIRYDELSKLPNVGSSTTQAAMIEYAEADIHAALGSRYGVPFSSTNITAKSLMVDKLYVQNMLTRQPEKAEALQKSIDARVAALLSGAASMVTATGAVAVTMVGDTVWSSSADYPSVFGMGDIVLSTVSSVQLQDEADARGEYL